MINSSKSSIIYGVHDRPSWPVSIMLGIQHVLLMFGGVILVPIIIGRAVDLAPKQIAFMIFASIIVSSISTIIQIVRIGVIGSGYMLFMGSAGAFIGASLNAVQLGGLALMATMTVISAPLEILCSYFIRYVRKIITPLK